MVSSCRILLAAVHLAAAASWPGGAVAFTNVEVGQRVENRSLPTLDGGRHALFDQAVRANVFVFVRPKQEHSTEVLRQMAECQRDFMGKSVHWVAIVSGAAAKEDVRALVAETGVQMTILVDDADALYGALGVRLHPTIGIADGEGKLLAYEPFRKVNYCDVVRARIRHALGEIDAAEVERTVHPGKALLPDEVPGAMANRYVNMGRMFARKGDLSKAESSAREALAKDSGWAPAHVLLGDVLAGKGDCEGAAKEYAEAGRLDAASLTAATSRDRCVK
jgi:hypothetical protein